MKNFLIFIAFIIIVAGLWNDLTNGSLPHAEKQQRKEVKAESKDLPSVPYEEVRVEAGDTVLSVLAALHGGRLPANIETAVADFEELNKGISSDNIRPGEHYKFPLYEEETSAGD